MSDASNNDNDPTVLTAALHNLGETLKHRQNDVRRLTERNNQLEGELREATSKFRDVTSKLREATSKVESSTQTVTLLKERVRFLESQINHEMLLKESRDEWARERERFTEQLRLRDVALDKILDYQYRLAVTPVEDGARPNQYPPTPMSSSNRTASVGAFLPSTPSGRKATSNSSQLNTSGTNRIGQVSAKRTTYYTLPPPAYSTAVKEETMDDATFLLSAKGKAPVTPRRVLTMKRRRQDSCDEEYEEEEAAGSDNTIDDIDVISSDAEVRKRRRPTHSRIRQSTPAPRKRPSASSAKQSPKYQQLGRK